MAKSNVKTTEPVIETTEETVVQDLVVETTIVPETNTEVKDEEVPAPVVHNVDELLVTHKNKSGVIRHLSATGMTRSEILKVMKTKFPNFLYQHVRNVLVTPLKK